MSAALDNARANLHATLGQRLLDADKDQEAIDEVIEAIEIFVTALILQAKESLR